MPIVVETPRRGASTSAASAPHIPGRVILGANHAVVRRFTSSRRDSGGRRVALALLSGFALCLASLGCSATPGATPSATPVPSPTPTTSPLPATTITFTPDGGEEAQLLVEVADAPEERRLGLMFRDSLPENTGMLFVWPDDTASGFWMRDTTIPLSIAFISADGIIVDIQDMAPLDETLHHSPEPYRWAVEANKGWFEEHGVRVGDALWAVSAGSTQFNWGIALLTPSPPP